MTSNERKVLLSTLRSVNLSNEQKSALKTLKHIDVTILRGRPGTAKTFTAVFAALKMLGDGEVSRIALTRPMVTTEEFGILPGTSDDKFDPYLYPIIEFINEYGIDFDKLVRDKAIRKAPIAFMRGQTVADEVLIVDEAQNVSPTQMLMVLTRIGQGGKIIITGDEDQSDLRVKTSGLDYAVALAQHIPEHITEITLTENRRSPLIDKIMDFWGQDVN